MPEGHFFHLWGQWFHVADNIYVRQCLAQDCQEMQERVGLPVDKD